MPEIYFDLQRIKHMLSVIEENIRHDEVPAQQILFAEGKINLSEPEKLRSFGSDELWGGYDCDAWFRVHYKVPANMAGKKIMAEFSTGRNGWYAVNPQFLAYLNGRSVQGLDVHHRAFIISENAVEGDEFVIDLDAWSGMVIRKEDGPQEYSNTPCNMGMKFFSIDEDTYKLYYDIKVPYEVAELLPHESKEFIEINKHLTAALNLLDLREIGSESYHHSLKTAIHYLEEEFYGKICGDTGVEALCVGHTHIDIAWLWTYAHTRRKTARSFATVLALMREYPEYTFISSQPQLYKFIKENHPEIYEEMKQRIKEGRWEPEGSSWVEGDCNISSGESLIRQMVYGKRFFKEEFGVDTKILWLPDVFGCCASLPQIAKKCGIDYFMTAKLSRNLTDMMPYDTFYWKGIDETKILTHFATARDKSEIPTSEMMRSKIVTDYNAKLSPNHVMGGWDRYQEKGINNYVLMSYGYGDGGGGTTREMVENLKRMNKGIPGCPVAKPSKAIDFFQRLEKDAYQNPRTPEWYGELYLEFHRGTYTSIAKNKRNNRKSELGLQMAEALSVMAMRAGVPYPTDTFRNDWESVLLNQFHDVLPGSSIRQVYDDTDVLYAKVLGDVTGVCDTAKTMLADSINVDGKAWVVFNTLGYERSGFVTVDAPQGIDCFGLDDGNNIIPVQKTYDKKIIFFAENVPGMGYKTYKIVAGQDSTESRIKLKDGTISNGLIKVTFDKKGRISSLFDLEENREVLKEGQTANVLETYEDRPFHYDAWEISAYYKEKRYDIDQLESFEIVEHGELRTVVKLVYKYLTSTICQYVIIWANSKRIDFVTQIDWKQEHILLKAAFPVEIVSQKATYEIQYGALERVTHTNTSWDTAKFEVCAQKWADISEDNYGVAILNDCKYGHDIHNGIIKLTLLKSATEPCINADQEIHNFIYSIVPHRGDWKDASIPRESYEINVPMTAVLTQDAKGNLSATDGMISSLSKNVNIEVLKLSEDGKDVIVRAYEAFGWRCNTVIKTGFKASKAFDCDMLENPINELIYSNNEIRFLIKPFEIKTIRFVLE